MADIGGWTLKATIQLLLITYRQTLMKYLIILLMALTNYAQAVEFDIGIGRTYTEHPVNGDYPSTYQGNAEVITLLYTF